MTFLRSMCLFYCCVAPVALADVDSFEDAPLGTITESVVSPLGTWTSSSQAEISQRRASHGTNALRLFGGDPATVTLRLATPLKSARVTFDIERWTARAPFHFAIEARTRDGWTPVYEDNGSAITIGGYNAHVEVFIDAEVRGLRFLCTAPEGGGCLIDQVSVQAPQPMKVITATTQQRVLPLLVGGAATPVARLEVQTEGMLKPLSIKSMTWEIESSNPLETLGIFAVAGTPLTPNATVSVPCDIALASGHNTIPLTLDVSDQTSIDGWLDARCVTCTLSDGTTLSPTDAGAGVRQRFGVSVRTGGDDGVKVYRIPGLVTTDRGTLIAVYDIRYDGSADLPADIDVGMSRSTDGGETWAPMQIIMDMGPGRGDGIGDPSVLFDPATNTLWVAALWCHGNLGWRGSGPGMTPDKTGQLILVNSTDDGETWSEPINITSQIKDPSWCLLLQGPGRGIAMRDGTLVFPAQFQAPPDKQRIPSSTIISSKDHGETWQIGAGARPNTTESQVVELEPGTLMLNMRDNRGGSRAVMLSDDLGQTWRPHPSSRGALPEPVCNAALIKVRETDDPRSPILAFVNPAVPKRPRRHMTLKLSLDGGLSWPEAYHLLLDEGSSAGYPSLTMIDEHTIGIFYEGSQAHLTFQRVNVENLLARPYSAN